LYDLPADGRQQKRPQARPASTLLAGKDFVNRAERAYKTALSIHASSKTCPVRWSRTGRYQTVRSGVERGDGGVPEDSLHGTGYFPCGSG